MLESLRKVGGSSYCHKAPIVLEGPGQLNSSLAAWQLLHARESLDCNRVPLDHRVPIAAKIWDPSATDLVAHSTEYRPSIRMAVGSIPGQVELECFRWQVEVYTTYLENMSWGFPKCCSLDFVHLYMPRILD